MRSPASDRSFNATTAFLLRGQPGGSCGIGTWVSMPPRRSCFVHGGHHDLPLCEGFQCHHGVPASGVSSRGWAHGTPVSMPPRRSCFSMICSASPSVSPVSMPPRRSCFGLARRTSWADRPRFNATTAFLLLGEPASTPVPQEGFNATTAFLLRGVLCSSVFSTPMFQCHHGVPASPSPPDPGPLPGRVSMPPRRSCFRSGSGGKSGSWECFNATTAFLLRSATGGLGGGFTVSMPPRRSCFPPVLSSSPSSRWGFNATTAFLLPTGSCRSSAEDPQVSMPPRRSCFSPAQQTVTSVWSDGFNATTAFLLPRHRGWEFHVFEPFQCHHGVPASWRPSLGRDPVRVSVSMPPRRSCFSGEILLATKRLFAFQCHHGVPASPGDPADRGGAAPRFNATTAFLLRWPMSGGARLL